ncbi:MAG TPA: hypothetical protein VFW23_18145 [Tepidisphaeraceae bacterium]|nr:hypothetical protein [Tepidisphaeraceae bacterium]
MQLTNQRKVSIGFVTLALAGFGWTMLGGAPQPQVPAAHRTPAAHAVVKSAPADETAAQLAQLCVIGHRLESVASGEQVDAAHTPDAFKPYAGLVADSKPTADPAAEAAAAAAKFRQQHHLLAILKSGKTAMALVDGKTLRPGQSLGAFKLVAVRERSVTFDSGAAQVELQVSGADPTAAASDELLIVPSRSGNDQ